MHLLTISLYELGQFLRIVLWVFVPLFVVVLLITTYLHHRRRRREALMESALALPEGELPVEGEEPGEDNLYRGLLWMKQKFEEYREQADERLGALRVQLDQRGDAIEVLKAELAQANEKIADLSGKLENNMSLMMNIHKELDRSLTGERTPASIEDVPAAMPEAARGGSGELEKE